MIGVVNVHKEKGYTSHDVVAILRRVYGTKKVGHTGTLDPDATGVLPICINRATKFADKLAANDKTYIAEIILGIETNTGDISGEVLVEKTVDFDPEKIQAAVLGFMGEQMQVPPMFSAIKIGGKKMYELARKGKTVEIPPRPVTIHHIQVMDFMPDKNAFTIQVKCSKGTYIRSLAVDIGKTLGCGATMGDLVRTQSGIFSIAQAYTLDAIKANPAPEDLIMPLGEILPYPTLLLDEEYIKQAKNGNPIPLSALPQAQPGTKVWVQCDQELIGLYHVGTNKLRPEVML